jgi:hypothetical protein
MTEMALDVMVSVSKDYDCYINGRYMLMVVPDEFRPPLPNSRINNADLQSAIEKLFLTWLEDNDSVDMYDFKVDATDVNFLILTNVNSKVYKGNSVVVDVWVEYRCLSPVCWAALSVVGPFRRSFSGYDSTFCWFGFFPRLCLAGSNNMNGSVVGPVGICLPEIVVNDMVVEDAVNAVRRDLRVCKLRPVYFKDKFFIYEMLINVFGREFYLPYEKMMAYEHVCNF